MNFKELIHFLQELNRHNSKDWMDDNRAWYHQVRNDFTQWLDELDFQLSVLDPEYYHTPGKKGINRINNNLMFHPNKPVYKDHFGAGLDKAPNSADFYIEIGISGSLLAGGLWRPAPSTLRSLREAIDFDGEQLLAILEKPSFKKTFGALYEDEKLRTTPKGFAKDHPYIELLRHKTFAVVHPLETKKVLTPNFQHTIVEVYMEMLPFRRYLNKAISV
ncbi:DUF2461 domain-containing protein [Muriicola sp.]|uniref:DUF2461 domain-containing protein n=1 Tax=Muriicola sp. TaxID=2020856 RepID=UPI003C787085